jgi:predicted nuclease of predicted toxin-antitoxin system
LRFKIDENLPADCAVILFHAGFEADTVFDEDLVGSDDSVIASRYRAEDRILVTLDLDFSNIRAYPPSQHAGIIVLRPKRQDKRTVLKLMERLILALAKRTPAGELWIVETDRIRLRVQ